MNLGMLVRADHRGLASMTGILARFLQPERVLLVDMGTHSPTDCHPDDYPHRFATVAYDDLLGGDYDWMPFLDGLDVVYTAEVPYDFGLFTAARHRGVRTVLHLMPELDPWVREPRLPRPDVIALPTTWLAERYPESPVLPVPVELFDAVPGPLVVHPGALAMKDRNGTRAVIDASEHTRHHLVVRCQAPPEHPWRHARVEVDDLPETRDLYDRAALVVVPRRYGGLSLVMQEAMAAGLPLLIPHTDPYADAMPFHVVAEEGRPIQTKGGTIPTFNVRPRALAHCIDTVMSDAGVRRQLAEASRTWAAAHTWERVRCQWDAVLSAA